MSATRTYAADLVSAVEGRLIVATLHGIVAEESGVLRLRLRVRLEGATLAGLAERLAGRPVAGLDSMVRDLRAIPRPLHRAILRLADVNGRRDAGLHDLELRAIGQPPSAEHATFRLCAVVTLLDHRMGPRQKDLADLGQHFLDEFSAVCWAPEQSTPSPGSTLAASPSRPAHGTARSHSRSVR